MAIVFVPRVRTRAALRVSPVLGAALVFAASAAAQPGSPQFTGGQILPNGFPDPLIPTSPGMIMAAGGSGGGSTGGGVVRGTASASINAGGTGFESNITLSGSAFHPPVGILADGFTGAASAQEIVFTLASPVSFTVTNNSLVGSYPINPVVLRSITGTLTGDPSVSGTMSAGTYGIRFAIAAGSRSGMSFVIGSNQNYAPFASLPEDYYLSSTLDWKLTMIPGPGAGAVMVMGGMIALRRRR